MLKFSLLAISVLVFSSIGFRILIASLGYNPDMTSWKSVIDIMTSGKTVYTETQFYNYGPIWAYILGTIGIIANTIQHASINSLHLMIAAFLAIIDVLISGLLAVMFSPIVGLIYLLNPTSALISGYHSQFDNLAILIGLGGWYFYLKSQANLNKKLYYLSAILFGISLATKHILIFFPIWLLLLPDKISLSLRQRAIYIGITYAIFISSFLIEIVRYLELAPTIINGIKLNVISYKSASGNSALINLIDIIFPSVIVNDLLSWIPLFKGYTFIHLSLIIASGVVFIRRLGVSKIIFPLYLLVFFSFSPAIVDQYLAIPLIATAIFFYRYEVILFQIIALYALISGPSANISNFITHPMLLSIGNLEIGIWPWTLPYKFTSAIAQAWLLLFSLVLIWQLYFKKYSSELELYKND